MDPLSVTAGVGLGSVAIGVCFTTFLSVKNKVQKWSGSSEEEWNLILDYYQLHIGPTLPPEMGGSMEVAVEWSHEKARSVLNSQTISDKYWQSLVRQNMGRGLWFGPAMDAVAEICSFLSDSTTRENLFQETYSLPRHFFLRELLTWLTHDLVPMRGVDINREIAVVQRRLSFLEALEMSDVMPNGLKMGFWEQEVTMRKVLTQVGGMIRWIVLPELRHIRERQAASRRIEQLRTDVRGCLFALPRYAFRVMREGSPCTALTLAAFLARDARYNEYLATGCGKLLWLLMETPGVREQFDTSTAGHIDVVKTVLLQNPFVRNGRIDRVCIPDQLSGGDCNKDEETFQQFFSQSGSGVAKELCNNTRLFQLFLRMHALTFEIMCFLPLLDKLQELSDGGGDLLVFGLLSGRVTRLLDSFSHVLRVLHGTIEEMELRTRSVYEDIIRLGRRNVSAWESNYRFSGARPLLDDLRDVLQQSGAIKQECESISLSERQRKVQQQLDAFWTASTEQLRRFSVLMGSVESPGHSAPLQLREVFPVMHGVAASEITPKIRFSPLGGDESKLKKLYRCKACGVETESDARRCSKCNKFKVEKFYRCSTKHEVPGIRGREGPTACPLCVPPQRTVSEALSSKGDLSPLLKVSNEGKLSEPILSAIDKILLLPEELEELSVIKGVLWHQRGSGPRVVLEQIGGNIVPSLVQTLEESERLGNPVNSILFKNFAPPLQLLRTILEGQEHGRWRLDVLWLVFDKERHNSSLGDAACVLIGQSVGLLRKLRLDGLGVTDEGIAELACAIRSNPRLSTLSLSFNSQLTDVGIRALCKAYETWPADAFFSLNLSSCGLSEASVTLLLALWQQHVNAKITLWNNSVEDGGSMSPAQIGIADAYLKRFKEMSMISTEVAKRS